MNPSLRPTLMIDVPPTNTIWCAQRYARSLAWREKAKMNVFAGNGKAYVRPDGEGVPAGEVILLGWATPDNGGTWHDAAPRI